jgi:hypothetical protein
LIVAIVTVVVVIVMVVIGVMVTAVVVIVMIVDSSDGNSRVIVMIVVVTMVTAVVIVIIVDSFDRVGNIEYYYLLGEESIRISSRGHRGRSPYCPVVSGAEKIPGECLFFLRLLDFVPGT